MSAAEGLTLSAIGFTGIQWAECWEEVEWAAGAKPEIRKLSLSERKEGREEERENG